MFESIVESILILKSCLHADLVSITRINAKAEPTNDNDYNCHTTAMELV